MKGWCARCVDELTEELRADCRWFQVFWLRDSAYCENCGDEGAGPDGVWVPDGRRVSEVRERQCAARALPGGAHGRAAGSAVGLPALDIAVPSNDER